MDNMHDWIVDIIKGCVHASPYEALADKKHLLVIAVSEEEMDKKFVKVLSEAGFNGNITFVAQPKMVSVLREMDWQCKEVIEWSGRYTLELAEILSDQKRFGDADGFVFFGVQSVNLRNQNLMKIAQALQAGRDIGIYSVDWDNELFKYSNTELFNRAMKLYVDINEFIDYYEDSKGKDVQ